MSNACINKSLAAYKTLKARYGEVVADALVTYISREKGMDTSKEFYIPTTGETREFLKRFNDNKLQSIRRGLKANPYLTQQAIVDYLQGVIRKAGDTYFIVRGFDYGPISKVAAVKEIFEPHLQLMQTIAQEYPDIFELKNTRQKQTIIVKITPRTLPVSKPSLQHTLFQAGSQSAFLADSTISYQFKVVNLITVNLSKINQWWKQLGNTDSFWNKLQQDLKIPKAQIVLFRNTEGNSIEEKLVSFAANYSYTIEINTSKEENPTYKQNEDGTFDWTTIIPENTIPTQYYSNLTVPGGTNYTENELATPAITPSIKGHAQFSTDKGIGWFRSDDAVKNAQIKNVPSEKKKQLLIKTWGDDSRYKELLSGNIDVYSDQLQGESDVIGGVLHDKDNNKFYYLHPDDMEPLLNTTPTKENIFKTQIGGELTKTRRILEVQTELVKLRLKLIKEGIDKGKWQVYDKKFTNKEEALKYQSELLANNPLLKMLFGEEEHWVTFFVKSIIQDSAKKGYEKVLFPSGNTASKVEQFDRIKEQIDKYENEIKALQKESENNGYNVWFYETGNEETSGGPFNSKEEAEKNRKNYLDKAKENLKHFEAANKNVVGTINFYENTVTNILKKQGYNPTLITDEYGNTWNEITIRAQRDSATILFQSTSQSTQSIEGLANKMRALLQTLGFTVQEVDKLLAPNGDEVIAEVNLLDSIIRIAKGKADVTTLPEEAATIVVNLVEGPLKDKMMKDITKFKIYDEVYATYSMFQNYQNEDGSVNIDKIKLEAISKLIAKHLVTDYVGNEDATNITGAMKWFQLVWNRIRALFSKLNYEDYNKSIIQPFKTIADAMAKGDLSSLTISADNISQETYYQAKPQESTAFNMADYVNKLVSKSTSIIKPDNSVEDSKYEYQNKKGVRITSISKAKYKAKYGTSMSQEDTASAKFGTELHEVQSYIIQKYFPEQNKHVIFSTPQEKLAQRAANLTPFENWVKQVKADGDILISEITVFGKAPVGKSYIDVGGTIDILRLSPDGKAAIYDLKTTKGVALSKIREWETQVNLYAHILQQGDSSLGLPPLKIYERRVIPFITRQSIMGREVRVTPIGFTDKLFLPLSSEEPRNQELASQIRKLRGIIELSEKLLKGAKDAAKDRIRETINRNTLLIEKLLLESEMEESLSSIAYEVGLLEMQVKNGVAPKEYKVITAQLAAYQSTLDYLPIEDATGKAAVIRDQTLGLLSTIRKELNLQEKNFLTTNVERLGLLNQLGLTKDGLFNSLKELGAAAAGVLGISANPNAIAQSLYLTVSEAQDKAMAEYEEAIEKLHSAMKGLQQKFGASLEAYDNLYQKTEDGEKTGRIVSQIKPEFYGAKRAALKKGGTEALKWFQENTEFDAEKYQKALESVTQNRTNPKNILAFASDLIRRAELKGTTLSQTDAEAIAKATIQKQLAEWVTKNKSIMIFNKPKLSKWTDPRFVKVMKDDVLKTYYTEYNNILTMLQEILPEHIQEGFIANFESEFLEKFRQHGVSALMDYAKESIKLRQNLNERGVPGPTGELLQDIPVFGLEELHGVDKSMDLTTTLAAFTFNALMYKHLSDVEHIGLMTMSQVAASKKYKTSLFGGLKTKNGQLDFIEGKGNLDKQIAAYVNNVFYGVNKLDNSERAGALADKLIKYTTATNLIFNMVSPVVDVLGNSSNALFTGAKGLFYGKRDIAWGISMASSGDLGITKEQRIAKALIKKFKILNERYAKDEQDKLNIQLAGLNFNNISKKALDSNTWFKPYQISDYVVQNAVLLAMLKSGKHSIKFSDYDINDKNELVWVGSGKEPGNLDLTKFRQAVKSVNKSISGNYDPYDAMMAKQYIAGRILLQHRGWLPAQFLERFGNERPDFILGQLVEGRYRTIASYLKTLIKEHNLAALKGEQLSANQKANMRANLAEMASLVGIFILLSLLSGDDDDVEQRKKYAYLIRVTSRWYNELMFFHDPTLDSVKDIIQSPVPSSSVLDKGTTFFKKTYDVLFNDEDPEKAIRSVARFAPGINGVWNTIDLLDGAVKGN